MPRLNLLIVFSTAWLAKWANVSWLTCLSDGEVYCVVDMVLGVVWAEQYVFPSSENYRTCITFMDISRTTMNACSEYQ